MAVLVHFAFWVMPQISKFFISLSVSINPSNLGVFTMNDFNDIAQQIAWHYEQLEELQYSPVVNSEGDVISFADWNELAE